MSRQVITVKTEIQPRHATKTLRKKAECAENTPLATGIEAQFRFFVPGMLLSDALQLVMLGPDGKTVIGSSDPKLRLFLHQTGIAFVTWRVDPPGTTVHFLEVFDELFELALVSERFGPVVEAPEPDVHWNSQQCDYCKVEVGVMCKLRIVTAKATGESHGIPIRFCQRSYTTQELPSGPVQNIAQFPVEYEVTPYRPDAYPAHAWGYQTNPVDHCPCYRLIGMRFRIPPTPDLYPPPVGYSTPPFVGAPLVSTPQGVPSGLEPVRPSEDVGPPFVNPKWGLTPGDFKVQ